MSGRIGCALRVVVLGLLAVTASAATPATCARYADAPIQTGRTPLATSELSGFTASRRHPNVYWAHDDSGHAAVLYAMRETGTIVATFPLANVEAVDPEDIAAGPCGREDRRTCLYLADTGDNLRGRRQVRIFRIREPETLRGAPPPRRSPSYIDGAHDTEAVLVDPRTAELYVITKTITSLGDVYHLERTPDGGWSAVRVASLAIADGFDALTTGASVHPDGERVLLRTYRGVWELRRPGARDLLDVLRTPAEPQPAPSQPQGEAVSYTADGTGYLLGSEGVGSPIFRIDCRTR